MDESLILVRQTICWRTADFVFVNEKLWRSAQLPEHAREDKATMAAIASLLTIDMVCAYHLVCSYGGLVAGVACAVGQRQRTGCCCPVGENRLPVRKYWCRRDAVQALYKDFERWFWQSAQQRPAWQEELAMFREERPKVRACVRMRVSIMEREREREGGRNREREPERASEQESERAI
jgi:hypothetical protein